MVSFYYPNQMVLAPEPHAGRPPQGVSAGGGSTRLRDQVELFDWSFRTHLPPPTLVRLSVAIACLDAWAE